MDFQSLASMGGITAAIAYFMQRGTKDFVSGYEKLKSFRNKAKDELKKQKELKEQQQMTENLQNLFERSFKAEMRKPLSDIYKHE